METVEEETGSDNVDSPYLLPAHHSCPPSRRMTGDSMTLTGDLRHLHEGSRRTSAIIAALRRPSQTLALTAAHTVMSQRRFVMELLDVNETQSNNNDQNKEQANKSVRKVFFTDSLAITMSTLYAKCLIVLGISFPVTEIISLRTPAGFFQGFYVYLYLVSVLFVTFVYMTIIRERAVFSIIQSLRNRKEQLNDKPKKHQKVVRYGSYYLRLGAIAFGIGSMVYSGLEFVQFFEMRKDPHCDNILRALTPAARMVLTIVQMQFIFLNSKEIRLQRHKIISRFGMMHMIATNLCQWLCVLVEETKHEIIHVEHGHSATTSDYFNLISEQQTGVNTTTNTSSSDFFPRTKRTTHDIYECQRSNIMGSLVQNASPFLYPCTIEYSLICAVVLFQMWKNTSVNNVKTKTEQPTRRTPLAGNTRRNSNTSANQEKLFQAFSQIFDGIRAPKSSHHFSVDCAGAHKGLFAGIVVIVMTIISLIMFFVLNRESTLKHMAIFQLNLCELILYILTLIAIATAMTQMRQFKHLNKHGRKSALGLDTTLLVMAQAGAFLYCMFTIIGCYFTLHEPDGSGVTGFVTELFSLIQTTIQTMFILDAWWRRCRTLQQSRTKPGRQAITFLLVANFAMWFINTLEKNRAEFRPTHLRFFGVWAWTIITHVSMPLAIFYRFHSSICLFEIWKAGYKIKFTPHK